MGVVCSLKALLKSTLTRKYHLKQSCFSDYNSLTFYEFNRPKNKNLEIICGGHLSLKLCYKILKIACKVTYETPCIFRTPGGPRPLTDPRPKNAHSRALKPWVAYKMHPWAGATGVEVPI